MLLALVLIGSLFYIGWRINKRYQEEGLGRAVASVVLLVVGILLCIFLGPVGLGTWDLNTICLFIVKFPLFRLVSLARRQPCRAFTHQKSKNFPNIEVGEFKKRKFFVRQEKSADNPLWINEHFDAVLRKICLFKPYCVQLPCA